MRRNLLISLLVCATESTYMVIIKFIIDKDGTVSDISPETNFGFGMEA